MNFQAHKFPCNCALAINQSKRHEVMCVIVCETHALEHQKEMVALARVVLKANNYKELSDLPKN